MMTPAGAVGLGALGLAATPLLIKRGGGCTNATTSPNIAVELGTTTISQTYLAQSIVQLPTGSFVEAIAGSTGVGLFPLSAPSLQVGSEFNVNYLSPGTGVSNPAVQILSSGANNTVAAVYTQGGTGKNVVDFTMLDNNFNVLNSTSTVLSLTGSLTSSSTVTTKGVMTALVSSGSTSNLPTLLLYPKTGGAPSQVTLGTIAVSNGAVATTQMSNGNIAVFWTSSGGIYGSVVNPSGSVVVTPIFVGSCATVAPVSVTQLKNGNLVFATINSSNEAVYNIVNAALTTVVKAATIVDGCTGETQVSVTQLQDGFGFLTNDGSSVNSYYLGPTGNLMGQIPVVTGSAANQGLSIVSSLTSPVGSSQMVVSVPQTGGSGVKVSFAQIDAAPQVSVPISSPKTFQVGEQVATPVSFTDVDAAWGDSLSYGVNTTPASGPNFSYNGTHLVGTIQPSNRGNFTTTLTATDTAGLQANTTLFGNALDAPLVVNPVNSTVGMLLGKPFSWFVPNGTITSIFNDTLIYSVPTPLPNGISFDAQTLQFFGTPTSANPLTIFQEVLQAVNPFGTRSNTTISFQTFSLPPVENSLLPLSLGATAGNSFLYDLGSQIYDVFSVVYNMSGIAPSVISINKNSGLMSGTPPLSAVGNYTLIIMVCDLFKCLTWQPPLSIIPPANPSPTPTTGQNGTATPPPTMPTAPVVTNPLAGYSVTTGQSFYLKLPSLCSVPVILNGTASVDWLTFGQDSSGDYYIQSKGSVPYTAYDVTPITVAIHIASKDDPSGPATIYDLPLGVQGLSAWQLAVAIVSPVLGITLSIAGFFGVNRWLQRRAVTGAKNAVSSIAGRARSLSRKSSQSNGMETGTLSDIPLTPPPKSRSDRE